VSTGLYTRSAVFPLNHNGGGMLTKICDQKYVCVCRQEFTIEIAQITATAAVTATKVK